MFDPSDHSEDALKALNGSASRRIRCRFNASSMASSRLVKIPASTRRSIFSRRLLGSWIGACMMDHKKDRIFKHVQKCTFMNISVSIDGGDRCVKGETTRRFIKFEWEVRIRKTRDLQV